MSRPDGPADVSCFPLWPLHQSIFEVFQEAERVAITYYPKYPKAKVYFPSVTRRQAGLAPEPIIFMFYNLLEEK